MASAREGWPAQGKAYAVAEILDITRPLFTQIEQERQAGRAEQEEQSGEGGGKSTRGIYKVVLRCSGSGEVVCAYIEGEPGFEAPGRGSIISFLGPVSAINSSRSIVLVERRPYTPNLEMLRTLLYGRGRAGATSDTM